MVGITEVSWRDLSPWIYSRLTYLSSFTGKQSSRLFSSLPPNILDLFSTQPITVNEHAFSLSSQSFNSNEYLSRDFNIISTNLDREGVEFVSSFEMKDKKIYATQFHPEKNAFNWNLPNVTHTGDGILAMQYLANRFLQDVRERDNPNNLSSNVPWGSLYVHNYPITYNSNAYFEIEYVFGDKSGGILKGNDAPTR